MLYPDMNLQKRTQQNTTRYRTALYLRLSREDGDKTESDSIANQRTLLEAYAIDHPELCIVDEFVDDGYSGSNFERPAFQNLFRELEQGTMQKNSGKSNFETKKVALSREMEQVSGNIVRLESQKRSGYEQYVLGKLSKEKFLELKQGVENEIVLLKQTKSEREKELAVVQEELQQKKQIAGNTEVLLTVDNLLQYVKKIEVDRRKITYTEFVF